MAQKIQINQEHLIESSADQTILSAMEKAGLQPEYHCRDGHCGACRCKLESGEIEEISAKMAYTNPDEILPCISRAKTDLTISQVRHTRSKKSA